MQLTPPIIIGISGLVLTVLNWLIAKNTKAKIRIACAIIVICVVAAIAWPASKKHPSNPTTAGNHSPIAVTFGSNSPAIQLQGKGNAQVNSANQTYNINGGNNQIGGTGNTMNVGVDKTQQAVTKDEIRSIFAMMNPTINQMIDGGSTELHVMVGTVGQVKLAELAERPGFKSFLSIEQTTVFTMDSQGSKIGDYIDDIGEQGSKTGFILRPTSALRN